MKQTSDVIIVGGGVSGLSTAYFLAARGIRSTIVERASCVGGLIRTDFIAGCRLEAGPDSFLAAKPAVTELAADLGDLSNQVIGSNDDARRVFIVRQGRLVPLPKGMVMMVPAEWGAVISSQLFSARTKLSFGAEIFSSPRQRSEDVSVEEFIGDHFAREVLEYVAEPLLAGVYGGESRQLSAASVLPRFLAYERKYGSLIRGVRHERRETPRDKSLFLSFRDGMQSLTDALSQSIAGCATVLHAEATAIERTLKSLRVKAGEQELESDQVVLAGPSHMSARLLESAAPLLAAELVAVPYSSCVLVTLVYERAALDHPLNGFGFLVPRAERRTIAAATWVSTKFPSRAPSHLAVLRAFIVDPEATSLLGAAEHDLVLRVRADLERFMGIEVNPVLSNVCSWPKSMPQYVVGHERRRGRIGELLREVPGLHLAGGAYQGVGIPDCIRLAEETANHIAGGRAAKQPSF